MRFDDLTEQARALSTFVETKGIKQPLCDVSRDARPGIDDLDDRRFRTARRDGHDQQLARLDVLHRFDCIALEVQHYVLDLERSR